MMEGTRHVLMKAASLAALYCLLYPGVTVARVFFFGNDGGIAAAMLDFVFLFMGYGVGAVILGNKSGISEKIAKTTVAEFLFDKNAKSDFISRIVAYLTLLLPLCSAPMIYMGNDLFMIIFETAVLSVMYFLGLRVNFLDIDKLIVLGRVHIGSLFLGAYVLIAEKASSFSYLTLYFYIFALGYILLSLFIMNQSSLDVEFIRKGTNSSGIPHNIRQYNTVLVILFFLLIVLLFKLKSFIIMVVKIFGMAVKLVIWLYLKLAEFLTPGNPGGVQSSRGAEAPFFGGGSPPPDPLWNYIVNTLAGFVIMYLSYRLLLLIIKLLKFLFRKLVEFVMMLLNSKDHNAKGLEEYRDEVETLKPDFLRTAGNAIMSFFTRKRGLKDITDPVEKVRFIYKTVVEIFVGRGIGIRPSDTTGEIFDKTKPRNSSPEMMKELTLLYDNIRYGERIPEAKEVESVEKAIDNI